MVVARLAPKFALLIACAIVQAQQVTAQSQPVEAIRAEWQSLRLHQPLPFGQVLRVAPDNYTGEVSQRPADVERGAKLAALAYRAADLGEAALALRLATEAVDADSDCEPARLALGYHRHEGEWLTAYGLRMAKRGVKWNATYGWIAPADLPRYEAGERRYRRRWVSGKVDAEQHSAIEQGWQIRTDHFNVTTNHSAKAGVALAAQLEQLHQVWLQLFADFAISDTELRARFEQHRVPGVRSRPFQVIYHQSQDEYNQALVRRQPRIAETIGIYFDHQREAHFFFTDRYVIESTLYHESVHQLFNESDRVRRDAGLESNFWAVEGVATWFESLHRHQAEEGEVYYSIGTTSAGRLPDARRKMLVDGYRVPLAELVSLGKRDLQTRTDLAPLYSQAAGLAGYLMATPQRQAAFAEYLRQIYAGTADSATLAHLCERSYPQLDKDYRAFLESLPAE